MTRNSTAQGVPHPPLKSDQDRSGFSRSLRQQPKNRTLYPKLVGQVEAWPLFQYRDSTKNIYVLGSREIDRYISVPGPKLRIVLEALRLFDGSHPLESIEAHLCAREQKRLDVHQLYQQLLESGLLATSVPAQARQGDIEKMSLRLFSIPVAWLFVRLHRLHRLLPWLAAAMLLLIVAGTQQAILHLQMLLDPATRAWNGASHLAEVLLYPLLLLASFLLHEMAHGIIASRYGIIARRFEAALYLGFIPIIYLRIPGLYTLRPVQRLKVWSAGIYWNLAFASFSILVWQWMAVSPGWHRVWLLTALANYFLAVMNLFPFLPTDGYFILCTLLKTYNVRSNAWKELRNWLGRRKRRFSWITVVYLICTVSVVIVVLWRDLAWLDQLARNGRLPWFGPVLAALPLALFMWRWLWRHRCERSRVPRPSAQEHSTNG